MRGPADVGVYPEPADHGPAGHSQPTVQSGSDPAHDRQPPHHRQPTLQKGSRPRSKVQGLPQPARCSDALRPAEAAVRPDQADRPVDAGKHAASGSDGVLQGVAGPHGPSVPPGSRKCPMAA